MTDHVPGELESRIRAFREERIPKMPPEIRETFAAETATLVASGIAARALAVGEHAPDFTLPDGRGRTVTLSERLAAGPVVVAFYRGVW
jgi:hypothetical protein